MKRARALVAKFLRENAGEVAAVVGEVASDGARKLPKGAARGVAQLAADAGAAGVAAALSGGKVGLDVPAALARAARGAGPRVVGLLQSVAAELAPPKGKRRR